MEKETHNSPFIIHNFSTGPWLVLDTACPRGIVAVVQQASVLAQATLLQSRRHAEQLPTAVAHVLQQAGLPVHALGGVAAGLGPGSFVGVRIGIAHAKGLASALGIPALGLPTLLALAASRTTSDSRCKLAVLGARRGEVFVQETRNEQGPPRPQNPPRVLAESDVAPVAARAGVIVGCGLTPQVTNCLRRLGALHEIDGPSATGLACLLHDRLRQTPDPTQEDKDECEQLSPLYLRAPDARPPTRTI
ncbi:MAG: tRNA (adenosine(37)-N6)-threonylcarbamoyltransferase complex dimerization subunit type 1 TsaB [Myxococcota bacterium]